MALKGNLCDFTITQLLNLINLAKKNGTLVIEGANEVAMVTFREGKLAYAQIGSEDNSLAAVLHQNYKINRAQYNILKSRTGQMGDKELGLLLINAGYVTQEDILASLQLYVVNTIRRLYTWMEGVFRFENDMMAPEDKINVRVDLENLIIEGARQLHEYEQLQEEIPSLEMALKFADRPGADLRNVNLSLEEWRVVSYINPKNSLRQISRTTKLNDMEIRRVAYSLLQAGLVEMVRPEGMRVPAARVYPTANKAEQKSLVNRLIDRVRSL